MSLVFSIPGKTFAAGEYAVLKGGAGLIAATTPRFEVSIQKGPGELLGIHDASPAGVFFHQHHDFFKNFSVQFRDELGLGGFGASTAQFLALYSFFEWREACEMETEKYLDHRRMLKAYLECAWQGQGVPPSGVDLIGQERGNLTLFDKSAGRMSSHSWSFTNLKFAIVHTGVKLATHEHLKNLEDFSEAGLLEAFAKIQKSLGGPESEAGFLSTNNREELFVQGIAEYAQALAQQKLTSQNSLNLLEEIRQISGVRAAKACGAMGSDVLFIVSDAASAPEDLQRFLRDQNLRLVATEKSLGEGLQMRVLQGDLF